jgi:hypothetical protein
MGIDMEVERIGERCPEDAVLSGWLEESSVYVLVEVADEDGDLEDPLTDF